MSYLIAPTRTLNYLDDIFRLVNKEDRVVRLYDSSSQKSGFIFHKCVRKEEDKQKEKKPISDLNIVWVDLVDIPDLLDKEGWPDFLKEAGCKLCTCSFAKKIANGEMGRITWKVTIEKKLVTLGV